MRDRNQDPWVKGLPVFVTDSDVTIVLFVLRSFCPLPSSCWVQQQGHTTTLEYSESAKSQFLSPMDQAAFSVDAGIMKKRG